MTDQAEVNPEADESNGPLVRWELRIEHRNPDDGDVAVAGQTRSHILAERLRREADRLDEIIDEDNIRASLSGNTPWDRAQRSVCDEAIIVIRDGSSPEPVRCDLPAEHTEVHQQSGGVAWWSGSGTLL